MSGSVKTVRRTQITVAVVGLFTLLLGTWGAAEWSLIPASVHGRVAKVEYQSETGYRWRILKVDDGSRWVIDRRITNQLGDWQRLGGQRIDKNAGARTLTVGRARASLAPSVEFWKVLFTFGAILALAIWRARWTLLPTLASGTDALAPEAEIPPTGEPRD